MCIHVHVHCQKSMLKAFDWKHGVLVILQFDPDVKWLAHNKLVCMLSKVFIMIESGLEQDAQGKMSGTFNTAQT